MRRILNLSILWAGLGLYLIVGGLRPIQDAWRHEGPGVIPVAVPGTGHYDPEGGGADPDTEPQEVSEAQYKRHNYAYGALMLGTGIFFLWMFANSVRRKEPPVQNDPEGGGADSPPRPRSTGFWARAAVKSWLLAVVVGCAVPLLLLLGLVVCRMVYGYDRDLPALEVAKIAGTAQIDPGGGIMFDAYNGSEWTVREILIEVVVKQKGDIFDKLAASQISPPPPPGVVLDEQIPPLPPGFVLERVVMQRRYRLSGFMGVTLPPFSSAKFSADLGFRLEPGQTWSFSVTSAKGTK